ncbi:dipeptide ABC transporter ATP-binding protein [Dongia sp.]|uniref:ABC transporter ATP-binding protein n=1 Tax=Dongia sp. TaxID=1977262 RepID=UPI0035B0A621
MTDLLKVNNLAIDFALEGGAVSAVKGVSFRVPAGKTVALVGESGSGKSVCAQAIMGLLPRSATIRSGEILLDRRACGGGDWGDKGGIVDIAKLERDGAEMRAIRGRAISIIFQEPMTSLSPVHTIGDQIGEALHLHFNVGEAEGRERVLATLHAVGFPDPERALRIYPFELSGGLRQRAMIAMALVCKPALLIADEPTTALDVTIQAQILKLMADLQKDLGMAMLMITHDLGVVANIADEVVVMYQGEVMESGPVEAIFRAPEHPYLKALMQAVPRFGMADDERLVPIREIKSEAGPLFKQKQAWPEGGDSAGPLLSVRNIQKGFTIRKGGFWSLKAQKKVMAVSDVSFDVKRGECLGLVGESGCGKTTLSKIVMKALSPDSGEILFNDRGRQIDVRNMTGADLNEYRKRVQFVFQDPIGSLNPRMTVFDIISEPLIIHKIGDAATRAEMVKELMALVGLDIRHLRRYPHSFSGGQRQRIGIARALALRPDLVICDEPVSALDVSIQAQILNLLKDLKAKLGLTYIFISHNLAVVDYVADRIMVMCAGRVVEMAPTQELFRNPQHPYTKALLAAVPNPSLDDCLDFGRVMEGKASQPAFWPAPFTIDGDNQPTLIDIGNEHWVRAALSIRRAAA